MAETPRSDAPALFHLCEGFVEAAELVRSEHAPQEWLVRIALTLEGTAALAALTRLRIGEHVRVVVGDALVVEARVQAVVESGRLESAPGPRLGAEALLRQLAAPPGAPCGARPPPA